MFKPVEAYRWHRAFASFGSVVVSGEADTRPNWPTASSSSKRRRGSLAGGLPKGRERRGGMVGPRPRKPLGVHPGAPTTGGELVHLVQILLRSFARAREE